MVLIITIKIIMKSGTKQQFVRINAPFCVKNWLPRNKMFQLFSSWVDVVFVEEILCRKNNNACYPIQDCFNNIFNNFLIILFFRHLDGNY